MSDDRTPRVVAGVCVVCGKTANSLLLMKSGTYHPKCLRVMVRAYKAVMRQ